VIAPAWRPTQRQLRQFSAAALPGFGLLAWIGFEATGSAQLATALAAAGACIALVGLIAPRAVRPVYWLALAITLPIGWLLSELLLRLIYYAVLGGFGVVLRALGHDPLQLRRPDGASHWLRRTQRRDPLSYYRQA